MRQMTVALQPTLAIDEQISEEQIFTCILRIKIRHQHRNTLKHSLSFEGLKCFLLTPESACSDISINTTPVAELPEKLWRAFTALFECPILTTGESTCILDPICFWTVWPPFSLGQIFKEFRYLINAPPKEASRNLNSVISLECLMGNSRTFRLVLNQNEIPILQYQYFLQTGNHRLYLASVSNTPPTKTQK